MLRAAALLVLWPLVATAQDFGLTPGNDQSPLTLDGDLRPRFDDSLQQNREDVRVESAPGAVLRGLDKVSGEVSDLTLDVGETVRLGRLDVTLGDCRYPADDPAGDAFAYLTIRSDALDEPAFMGWMVASSPALSALDHPRYDVWVMRCSSS
jgi:hypothetical protein